METLGKDTNMFKVNNKDPKKFLRKSFLPEAFLKLTDFFHCVLREKLSP